MKSVCAYIFSLEHRYCKSSDVFIIIIIEVNVLNKKVPHSSFLLYVGTSFTFICLSHNTNAIRHHTSTFDRETRTDVLRPTTRTAPFTFIHHDLCSSVSRHSNSMPCHTRDAELSCTYNLARRQNHQLNDVYLMMNV